MSESEVSPAPDDAVPATVDVSEVTAPDPLETEPVQLVSGTVDVPVRKPVYDGVAKTMGGALQYSDNHCPLLVADSDKVTGTVIEETYNEDGSVLSSVKHRVPEQVVVNPATCPTCEKIVERHMLVTDRFGGYDCAIATNLRARGKSDADLAAILGAAPGDAIALANAGGEEPVAPDAVEESV